MKPRNKRDIVFPSDGCVNFFCVNFLSFFVLLNQTLTNAQMALFSATAELPALTCLGGTTVSVEMATTTMGCFHQVGNPVKVSI